MNLKRVGLLVPSADVMVEYDFHCFLPDKVAFHTNRLDQGTGSFVSAETLERIVAESEEAAAVLSHAKPEAILFCCTSASFLKGFGFDRAIAENLSKASGVPASTTATAVVGALNAVGARSIFMVTPYPDSINRIEIRFLEDHGIEVSDHFNFECVRSADIPRVAPADIRRAVLENKERVVSSDAVFISCTNLPAMQIAHDLEVELNVPVVTSNSATLWAALDLIAADGSAVRAGRLFQARRES